MKMNRQRKSSAAVNLGFQIAPMVDVVFVILLFFMVMAGSVQVEKVLNAQLPTHDLIHPADVPLPAEIAIGIADDGQVSLNDDPLDSPSSKSLPALADNLKQLRASSNASGSNLLVTIYANEQARYERIIDVLDALSLAQISNVTFQATAPE